jgi:uncharacterized protein (TIGR02246 family)
MRLLVLAAFLTILAVPLFAEQPDHSGWQYDAVMPEHLSDASNPIAAEVNSINDLLAKMLDSWNAHDVDTYLSVFWKSPQLLVVFENEQYQGWEALCAAYQKGSHDPVDMGLIRSTRLQIKLTRPDLALVQDTWIVHYPTKDAQLVGDSSMTVQKLDGTWKIVSSYSRYSPVTSRGWEYDSIAPERPTATPSSEQADLKAINDLLAKVDACWNAHDIDGMMAAYWNSPHLIIVDGEEQVQGWQVLYNSFKTGYPDPSAMGHIEPSRVQIKLLKADLALALNWWTVTYPNSKTHVVGNTTMNLQKFNDGWKIVMAHSSFVEP